MGILCNKVNHNLDPKANPPTQGVTDDELTSQRETDMGRGPVFYSTLAQLECVGGEGRGARAEG